MIRHRCLACAILAALPGVSEAQPAIVPPAAPPSTPPTVSPSIPPVAAEAAWPPPMKLAQLRSPDWSDPDLYPAEARRLNQQGNVTAEVLIGKDGVPRACRTYRSSGYPALDAGTCALLMQVRYVRPVDGQGRPVEATQRSMIVWRLSPEPTRFAASGMTVRLRPEPGAPLLPLKPGKCEVTGTGPLFPEWAKTACAVFAGERAYYLGEHRHTATGASLFVAMTPASSKPTWTDAGLGRLVSSRRIHFEVDRKGNMRNCRTSIDQGLARLGIDRSYPCGMFLFQHRFGKVGQDQRPRSGVIEIRAFVDERP